MARARNIKPGFYKNYDLADAGPIAQLLFSGLWCLADREGRLEDKPRLIKAELFPYYDADVNGELTKLERLNFLHRYEVNGVALIEIINFKKHQTPHNTEKASSLPARPLPNNENVGVSTVSSDNGELTVNSRNNNDGKTPDLLIHRFTDSPIPDSQIQDEPQAAIVPKPKKYEFAKELIALGVESKVVDAWMQVRKTKKATNSEIALVALKREAAKAGLSIADAVRLCVEKSWSGLDADWLKPKSQASPMPQKGLEHLGKHGQATATAAQQWLEESNAG